VETLNSGAVWMGPDLEPAQRQIVAAAASALLLLEDLRGSLQEQ
jgi:hypothetical protein